MTTPTHIAAGVLIGALTGNWAVAILVSVLVDLDHLFSYVKSGVIFSPQKFWRTITDKEDATGDQRNILHNIFIAILISFGIYFIFPSIFLTFACAYFGHLILDTLDTSEYWPLYPSKLITLRGYIDFYSRYEVFFASGLVALSLLSVFFM